MRAPEPATDGHAAEPPAGPRADAAFVERLVDAVRAADPFWLTGRVTQVVGLLIQARGPLANVGDLCLVRPKPPRTRGAHQRWVRWAPRGPRAAAGAVAERAPEPVYAEVVGFKNGEVLLLALGEMTGIAPGSEVIAVGHPFEIPVGPSLLGRVVDAFGRPIDRRGPVVAEAYYPVTTGEPPRPLDRVRISEPLPVGVRAVDACLTCGKGQRMGIFSGSGVGKSTLLGMIARNTAAAVSVVALVGERGREVREFLERDLGPEGLSRSVVVVATSDEPPLVRVKAAFTATAIAEYFRDRGQDVLLMMDSVTRFCMAQREIGLTAGEPPTTRGYTPSVFALLPRLLERTGTAHQGTITGFYTVLVDGDDMNEPVADAMRSLLDGHVVLSRRLAAQGHYPPIDILESTSRVMIDIVSPEHQAAAGVLRRLLAAYHDAEDLINVGAYRPGSNPDVDRARAMLDEIKAYLRQDVGERVPFEAARTALIRLARRSEEVRQG